MRLAAHKRLCLMPKPLISSVVCIHKHLLPSGRHGFHINRKPVVLCCYVAPLCACVNAWLVLASVSVFQFVCVPSGSQRHYLVSKAYSEYWYVLLHGGSHVPYSGSAHLRVAWAVAYYYSVI